MVFAKIKKHSLISLMREPSRNLETGEESSLFWGEGRDKAEALPTYGESSKVTNQDGVQDQQR